MLTKDYIKQVQSNSEIFKKITEKCHTFLRALPQGAPTLNYAIHQRQISNNKIDKYQFGYFPSEDQLHLFSEEEKKFLIQERILYKKDHIYLSSFSHHTLMLPLIDDYGQYIGLIARTIDDEKCKEANLPKYKHNIFFKSSFLFGLFFAKEAIAYRKSVILVEGQLDCITSHSYGFHHAVGLGSTTFTFYHAFLLKKYGVKKIYLIFDNDENNSGLKGRKKIHTQFDDWFEIKDLYLPNDYKDIDMYLKQSKDISLLFEAI